MIVGFTITDYKGAEQAAAEYIQRVCFLESIDEAKSMIEVCRDAYLNVFPGYVDEEELRNQPFETTLIKTKSEQFIVASNISFVVELPIGGNITRLLPNSYFFISKAHKEALRLPLRQGIIKTYPDLDYSDDFVLSGGTWNDDGVWEDSNTWKDAE